MSTFCEQILLNLEQKGIAAKADHLQHYFKTGPGGYGEGDVFLGVPVPEQRKIAKAIAQDASLAQLSELVQHPYHEMRLTGLLGLVYKFEKTRTESLRGEFVNFYLDHLDYINNWDLVDSSCYQILGAYY